MLKRLSVMFLAIALPLVVVLPAISQGDNPECSPEAAAEWMIQRQLGRNRINTLGGSDTKPVDALLIVQQTRRELEDSPRPACADDLYHLTVYLYNLIGDQFTYAIAGEQETGIALANERYVLYRNNIDALYDELEAIAGIDILEAASQIQSVEPTATPSPTEVPFPGIQFEGTGKDVYGPFEFPDGLYVVECTMQISESFTSYGNLNLDFDAVSGSGSEHASFTTEEVREIIGRDTIRFYDHTEGAYLITVSPFSFSSWSCDISRP